MSAACGAIRDRRPPFGAPEPRNAVARVRRPRFSAAPTRGTPGSGKIHFAERSERFRDAGVSPEIIRGAKCRISRNSLFSMASTPFGFAPPSRKLLWPAPLRSPARGHRLLKNNTARQRLWQEIVGFLSRAPPAGPRKVSGAHSRSVDTAWRIQLEPERVAEVALRGSDHPRSTVKTQLILTIGEPFWGGFLPSPRAPGNGRT
jgi:hypothetical protein